MSVSDPCPVCGTLSEGACRRCLVDSLFNEQSEFFDLPEELGGFQLLERIGRGASGEVWMAFQPGPDRKVAVKVFLDPRLGGSADRSRFRAEAQALGKLDDPGIVPVYATGEEGGFLFIASKWMPGGTLADRQLLAASRSDWGEVARMVAIIANAIAHAHGHGLVHRDIKPANILLDENGEPYLADFGIAEPEGLRDRGSTSGTPAFMAPEQARGEAVTTAADIYSLGALMHDLLTGSPPLQVADASPELHSVNRDLAAICLKCLSVRPADRYPSAIALASDLEAWRRGEPVSARQNSVTERLVKWARRRPALAALSSLVGLTALILVITLVVGSEALRRERNEALKQEEVARKQEQFAKATAASAREQAYAADIYLASRALDDGQLGVARQMLERHQRMEDGIDLRGFEWFAYRSRCEGEEEQRFTDHDGVVSAVAFSPDGKYLASASWAGSVMIRELDEMKEVLRLPHPDGPSKGAAEIPLMTKVLARSPELRRKVLSAQLNVDEFRMRGRPSRLGELTAFAWAPNGKVFATAGEGSYVRLWNFPEGDLIGALPLQHGRKMLFSECGQFLVTLEGPNSRFRLVIHEMDGLELRDSVENVGPAFDLKDGALIYQSAQSHKLEIRGLESLDVEAAWKADGTMSDLAFSSDGLRVDGISTEGGVQWCWTRQGERLDAPDGPLRGVSRVIAVAADHLALAGTGQMVGIRSGEDGGDLRMLRGHEDEITDLDASADGMWLASASKDRTVRLWSVTEDRSGSGGVSKGLPPLKAHSPGCEAWLSETDDGRVFLGLVGDVQYQLGKEAVCRALAFSGDGNRAATWRDLDEGVSVEWWSVEDGSRGGSILLEVAATPPRVVAVGGGRILVTGEAGGVESFDLESGTKLGSLPETDRGVLRMVVAPDGEQVAAVYWPRKVIVGKIGETWREPVSLTSGVLGPLAFSPDGTLIASGNNENRVVVHDARSGELLQVMLGHREPLVALAFSPDGRSLVSSSLDRTVRLWHVPTWRDLGVFSRGSVINYLGFDSGGRGMLMGAWGKKPSYVPDERKTPPPR